MLTNYQNLQMGTVPLLIHPNFATLLLPTQPSIPTIQHSSMDNNNFTQPIQSPSMMDFSMLKMNPNLAETPSVLSGQITSPTNFTQLAFQPPSLSIPDMVANTSGFNFLPTYGQNSSPFMVQQNSLFNGWTQPMNCADRQAQKLSELLKAMMATSGSNVNQQVIRPSDMPVLSPLLPGIGSTTMQNFATLPLVQANDGIKDPQTTFSTIQPTTQYPIPSPPILEQQIPQDPTTTTIFTSTITNCEPMPSTSHTFPMPIFHSIFDLPLTEKPQFDELSTSSAPSSPPVLTRVEEEPIQNDDPNPPALKPEVITDRDQRGFSQQTDETSDPLLRNDLSKLDQEEDLVEPTLPLESSSRDDTLNNTETSTSDSEPPKETRQLNLDEEPLLDSLEAIRKFSDELKLSQADWLEIMTESRRRRLRPSTQANTVATLTKITGQKTGKHGRKLRSSGSSERDVPNAKVAKMDNQFNEQESENRAPKSDLYSSPISIDVDLCKSTHGNSTPSSSGISSASNLSETSPRSKLKVLRRSKNNNNTVWLGSSQEFNEEQKENVVLARMQDDGQKSGKRRHTIGCKKTVKKPKRIKSNWLPIGEASENLVRTCNDTSPVVRECYTSIRHRHETDEIIKIRDCIKVRSAEGLENIGKVLNFYVDENGYLMASVLWYYTREQIEIAKNQILNPLHEKELVASRHIDHIACDTIESIAFVLTFNEYCRYITEGQIDSLPVCLRPLESQEIWSRGEENYPRRSRLPFENTPFEVVYFSRRVYDIKTKRVYVPKLSSSTMLRPTRSSLIRPTRASSH